MSKQRALFHRATPLDYENIRPVVNVCVMRRPRPVFALLLVRAAATAETSIILVVCCKTMWGRASKQLVSSHRARGRRRQKVTNIKWLHYNVSPN